MAEYIDREALYEKAYWHGEHLDVDNPFPDGVEAIDIKDVDAIPAADVAPVAHGRWISKNDHGYEWVFVCSNCDYVDGYPFNDRSNYCQIVVRRWIEVKHNCDEFDCDTTMIEKKYYKSC